MELWHGAFFFQFQHACGITLLTDIAQAADGTRALSVWTKSWYLFCLLVCAHNVSRIKKRGTHEFTQIFHRRCETCCSLEGKLHSSFFLQVLFNIHIYIKTRYSHFTTRQAHPEWICRSPLSWLWLLKFLFSFKSTLNMHLLIIITCENPLFPPCDLFT